MKMALAVNYSHYIIDGIATFVNGEPVVYMYCSYVAHHIMKIKPVVIALAFGSSLFLTNQVMGQSGDAMRESKRVDSLYNVAKEQKLN
jgi:hypothetical protein